jgi:glycogen debranching enzyme
MSCAVRSCCVVDRSVDNCHNTPRHVAEFMLDAARNVRPDILLLGEFFSGSREADLDFANALGLHLLLREGVRERAGTLVSVRCSPLKLYHAAQRHATSATDIGRLVYECGGTDSPGRLQSYDCMLLDRAPSDEHAFSVGHAASRTVPAYLADITHDNEPMDVRNTAALAAIVSSTRCAVGT